MNQQRQFERNNSRDRRNNNFAALGELALGGGYNYNQNNNLNQYNQYPTKQNNDYQYENNHYDSQRNTNNYANQLTIERNNQYQQPSNMNIRNQFISQRNNQNDYYGENLNKQQLQGFSSNQRGQNFNEYNRTGGMQHDYMEQYNKPKNYMVEQNAGWGQNNFRNGINSNSVGKRPPSQEDISGAQNGLRLLKQKINLGETYKKNSFLPNNDDQPTLYNPKGMPPRQPNYQTTYNKPLNKPPINRNITQQEDRQNYIPKQLGYQQGNKNVYYNNNQRMYDDRQNTYEQQPYQQMYGQQTYQQPQEQQQSIQSRQPREMSNQRKQQLWEDADPPEQDDYWDKLNKQVQVQQPTSKRQQNLNRRQNKQMLNRPQSQEAKRQLDHDEVPAFAQGINNMVYFILILQGKPVQEFNDDFDENDLLECPEGCGRKFNNQALDKHRNACQKVFLSKRKQFNTKQHRLINDEQEKLVQQAEMENKRNKKSENKQKQQKWKAQSEGFRAQLKVQNGQEITEKEQLAINEANEIDRFKCDHCGRKFNEAAAKRHIPLCETKTKLMEQKNRDKPKKQPK